MRVAVALGLVAAALVVPAAQATTQPVLAGATTITAPRSGSLDVVMNEDAVIRLQPDGTTRDVSLLGPGRFVAFSMTFEGNAYDELQATRSTVGPRQVTDTFVSGTAYPKSNTCPQPAVPSVPGVYQGCTSNFKPVKYVVLHQGRYHVRVLTDGSPLTVRLTLHGLPGNAALRTARTLTSVVEPMQDLDAVAGRYVRAEAGLTSTRPAELMYRVDASTTSGAHLHGATECLYDSSVQLPTDYAPGCPAGNGSGSSWLLFDPQGLTIGNAWIGGSGEVSAGTHRFGVGLTNDAGVEIRAGWAALLQSEG